MNHSELDLTTTSSWVESENVTNATENGRGGEGPVFSRSRYSYARIMDPITYVIGSVGSMANGFVMLALLCARDSRRKKINVFIINQTVLDLLACVCLVRPSVLSSAHHVLQRSLHTGDSDYSAMSSSTNNQFLASLVVCSTCCFTFMDLLPECSTYLSSIQPSRPRPLCSCSVAL